MMRAGELPPQQVRVISTGRGGHPIGTKSDRLKNCRKIGLAMWPIGEQTLIPIGHCYQLIPQGERSIIFKLTSSRYYCV